MNHKSIYWQPYIWLLFIVILSSCEKLELDTKGQVSQLTYYTSEKELEEGLIGIFSSLRRANWSTDILAAYTGGEDLVGRSCGCKWTYLAADNFYRTDRNSAMNWIWNYHYQTIYYCNSFLTHAGNSNINEAVLNNALANARFIRGMLYFQLATIFNEIPMPLSPEPDSTMLKTPMLNVISQSILDLEYAVEWSNGIRDTDPTIPDGHITKTAAKAFLAKAYLQLTGWPYFETDNWIKVKELTQSIIDDGVYTLMDDYSMCFQDPYQMNREMIFSIINEKNDWPVDAHTRYFGYKWCDWGDFFIEENYYNNIPDGYRKSYSTVSIADTIYDDPVTRKFERFLMTWRHAMVSKFMYATIEELPEFEHKWQSSNDIPLMRFSEVLLMYAEACAQLGEHEEAIEKLNWVKRRAYAKGLRYQKDVSELPSEFWLNPDSKIDYTSNNLSTSEAIINAIIDERAYEFLGEPGGVHWLDLLRHEKIVEANSNRAEIDGEFLGDITDPDNWFFPIPGYEVELNPNLK